uniref:FLZ-type domain-containing protein n=1 Tax=Oryza nivara TaxID=4536 RepID=A0A0E0FH56_ORYNI
MVLPMSSQAGGGGGGGGGGGKVGFGLAAMLRRMVVSDTDAGGGGGEAGRVRGGGGGGAALFAVPRLFVGLAAKRGAGDGGEPASRSPTSPLDPKALLLRSPRSPRTWWDAEPVGLALAAAADDDAAKNCLLLSPRVGPLKSFASLPKDCGGGHSPRPGELAKAMSCAAAATATASAAGGMSVPCGVFFYGDLKSGPEATRSGGAHPNAKRRSFDLGGGKIPGPGSLPASIGGVRRFIGSVSASEIEQSEDYTCIIARGPNPKTTHIFGDCILEPQTMDASASAAAMDVTEAPTESYWVVKCDAGAAPASGGGGGNFLSSCFTCKKKLEGNDIYIYRGEKAFCSANCRDQQILIEEEAENNTTIVSSPRSSCSSLHEDIFMAGMFVAT